MNFIEEFRDFLQKNDINWEQIPETDAFYLLDTNLIIQAILLKNPRIFEQKDRRYYQKIQLWEDVWHSKKVICQSRILALIGRTVRIPARLTKVRRIDKQQLDNFLIINHLQASTNAKLKYGLFLPKQYFRVLVETFPDEKTELLVAVASFSAARKFVRNGETFRSFELIRFANLLNHTVVGGLDKLLKNFIKEQSPDDIMTYADRDWSDGRSYEKLGFENIEIKPPQAFLVDTNSFERFYEKSIQPSDNVERHPQQLIEIKNTGNIKFLLKLNKK